MAALTDGWLIPTAAIAYLSLLFGIAYVGDRRAEQGRSLINSPYVYALSIAVYCTSWTFYGSVGRAAQAGPQFLPIYIGPTLMAALWWVVLRKIVRIAKRNRITSIADFIGSRYGKSRLLGGLVTVIAIIGIVPYISLQLKAIAASYGALTGQALLEPQPLLTDSAFHVAVLLAVFSILFGTRHIDASEHHEGMVAAVAFESSVKLVAFLAVGVFVVYGLFDGFGDLFARAERHPEFARLFTLDGRAQISWVAVTLLSALVIVCLPRQFQVAVVENVDERHVAKAIWLFPAYLLAINVFVLPIALAGVLSLPAGSVHPDLYVLALPMVSGAESMALLVFLGGLSAGTGMVIVETVALSTMACNDLIMPLLLRWHWAGLGRRSDLSRLLLLIRRLTIVGVVMLGYFYERLIGQAFSLVGIGLMSFAAAAQFAPVLLGGIFWKGATRRGALAGLSAGFAVWAYTLLLPSLALSGWLPHTIVEHGPFGIALLRPQELFGMSGLDPISHALIWSMLANVGSYLLVSLFTEPTDIERVQAALFVDVFRPAGHSAQARAWRGTATVSDLVALVGRFVGIERTQSAFARYAQTHRLDLASLAQADADLVAFAERLLAGAIGAGSARVMLASVVKGETLGLSGVLEILDEAQQVIAYSRQLQAKSYELEKTSAELRAANERLQQLDRLKDDFINTVTHELRTPLTSIRSFSEILRDNPGLPMVQRQEFLGIVISESERLTRLVNQVLDLAKLEAGAVQWTITQVDMGAVVRAAIEATGSLFSDKRVALVARLPEQPLPIRGDRDRLIQVAINLLSNAVKFCPPEKGRVTVTLEREDDRIRLSIADNGPGIPDWAKDVVFEKFLQVGDTMTEKPQGTGLGLAICRHIVVHLGGRIWVESAAGQGACFRIELPALAPVAHGAAVA